MLTPHIKNEYQDTQEVTQTSILAHRARERKLKLASKK